MSAKQWQLNARVLGVGIGVATPLGVLWAMIQRGYFGRASDGLFVGWLCVVFLVSTIVAILIGSIGARNGREALAMGATLIVICGGMLFLIAIEQSRIAWASCGQAALMNTAWTFLWLAVSWSGRWGGGRFAGIVLLLAMMMFASPVIAVPLVKASRGGVQNGAIAAVGYSSPMIGVMNVIGHEITIGGGGKSGWLEMPVMYHLTPLGQDMAAPAPRWWIAVMIYTGVGMAAWVAGAKWTVKKVADRQQTQVSGGL